MKRFAALFAALSLALLLLLFAAACSSDTDETENPGADMTVDEIMAQLIEGVNSEISTASIPLIDIRIAIPLLTTSKAPKAWPPKP